MSILDCCTCIGVVVFAIGMAAMIGVVLTLTIYQWRNLLRDIHGLYYLDAAVREKKAREASGAFPLPKGEE